MIEKGADDFNRGMNSACYEGHKELVLLMIEKGADSWNDGLGNAWSGKQKEIILLMIEKGANNWNEQFHINNDTRKLSISLTMDDYIYLYHKNVKLYNNEKFDLKIELYTLKKWIVLNNFQDSWVKRLFNNYL